MVLMVRKSRGILSKSGKVGGKLEDQKKSGNLTFQSQGKIRGSGKVRENHSTRVQKLTKMQKKI